MALSLRLKVNVPIHLPFSLYLHLCFFKATEAWHGYLFWNSKCTYLSHWQPFLTYSKISMPFQWQSWKMPIHSVESFSHFYLSSIETSFLWRISRSKAHQLEVYQVHLSLSPSLSFPLVLRHNALIPASPGSFRPILFGGLPTGFQKSSADVRCNVVYVYGFDICFFFVAADFTLLHPFASCDPGYLHSARVYVLFN